MMTPMQLESATGMELNSTYYSVSDGNTKSIPLRLTPFPVNRRQSWEVWRFLILHYFSVDQLGRFSVSESFLGDVAEISETPSRGILSLSNLWGRIIAASGSPELRDALRDLDEARDEAHEEGFSPPSDMALRNARWLLYAMHGISPRRFEVYPTPDREVAIAAPGGSGRSLLLLCDSGGGALCLVNMNGAHRRARYSNADLLPDSFVREALHDLE